MKFTAVIKAEFLASLHYSVQCHMILQKSFQYADFLLKTYFSILLTYYDLENTTLKFIYCIGQILCKLCIRTRHNFHLKIFSKFTCIYCRGKCLGAAHTWMAGSSYWSENWRWTGNVHWSHVSWSLLFLLSGKWSYLHRLKCFYFLKE